MAVKLKKFTPIKIAEFGEYYTFETEWHDRIMIALKKNGIKHEKDNHLQDLVNYFTKVRGFKNEGEGFLSEKIFVATCLMNEFFETKTAKIISIEAITVGDARKGNRVVVEESFWGYRVYYQ
jgi:hypothetical protein